MLTNKGSVYDLATVYILLYANNEKLSEKKYENIINEFSYILDIGYTFKDCISAMTHNLNKNDFMISDIKAYKPSNGKNLIKQNQMYYHKELRVQAEPSVIDIDYNTGAMVSTTPEYFIEIVASYTMEDLMKYLMSFGYVDTKQWQYTRLYNLLKYYVNKYNLETVLFMLEAINDGIEEKYFDFNKIDDYYQTAKKYMNNIINNCKTNGGDIIAPRKRKLD